jgi:hypothetical protein
MQRKLKGQYLFLWKGTWRNKKEKKQKKNKTEDKEISM